jgi:hypothetical protein
MNFSKVSKISQKYKKTFYKYKIMKNIKYDNVQLIFTTGAFLKPMKIIDYNGNEKWIWYVTEFIDDSFLNGEIYNPKETSFNKKGFLKNTTPIK